MHSQRTSQIDSFVQAYITLNRFPTYSEYLHFFDSCKPLGNFHSAKSDVIYIDVTQMLKQVHLTGIQRVVSPFMDLKRENIKLVHFQNGKYELLNNPDNKKTFRRLNDIRLRFVTTMWRFWEYSLKFHLINKYKALIIPLAKKMRNVLLPKVIVNAPATSIENLIEGNLFIPDLPSQRDHLEAIYILTKFDIMRVTILLHDLIPFVEPHLMPTASTGEFNLYVQCVLNADRVITISEKVKNDLLLVSRFLNNEISDQRVVVLDLPTKSKDYDVSNVNLEKFKFDTSLPFFLSIGTVLVRKNYSVIVRALKLLEEKKIRCNYVIASHHNWGDPSLDISISELTSNRVIFVKNLSDEDLAFLLEKSVALVFPSLSEGFGLPILEAASQGKTVIVNDIPPMSTFSEKYSNIKVVPSNSGILWSKYLNLELSNPTAYAVAEKNVIDWNGWSETVISHIL